MSAADLAESVRAKLVKILALAESGVAGERDEARRLLELLCRKYRVDPETLVSNKKSDVRFPIPDARSWELFKQCYFFVFQKTEIRYNKPRKACVLELTDAEAIDLRACYEHYRKLYKREEADLFTAFLCKHSIFGPSTGEREGEPIDPERLARLLAMMRGMSNTNTWKRPAAALTR